MWYGVILPEKIWEDYCDKCIEAHECGEDYVMPIVNSPRTGVCGYVGPFEQ